MEDTSFENSLCDVLSNGQVPIHEGISQQPRRGMPARNEEAIRGNLTGVENDRVAVKC